MMDRDLWSWESSARLALSLLWAACTSGAMHEQKPGLDAGVDASPLDASDSETAVHPCDPGTAGPRCGPCPAGSYCPGGMAPMAWCETNMFDADQDPTTPCVAARSCPPGSYVALPYSRVTDQRCGTCPTGTYSTHENTRSCSDFSTCGSAQYELHAPTPQHDRSCADYTACAADEFIAQPGSATEDRVCQRTRTCHADEFEQHAPTEASDRECAPRTICKPGERVSMQPTATSNRRCAYCATGSFSTIENASACQVWSTCSASEIESSAPSSTRDRACVPRSTCPPSPDEDAGTQPGDCTDP